MSCTFRHKSVSEVRRKARLAVGFEIQNPKSCPCARHPHLLGQFIQHACADCGSVSAEDVLLGLLHLPVVFVPASQQDTRL